jgi:serine/threonine-protein kinase HipA
MSDRLHAIGILASAVYAPLTPKMPMKLGSHYKFTEVQARHWPVQGAD